jgi:hypothetical protein
MHFGGNNNAAGLDATSENAPRHAQANDEQAFLAGEAQIARDAIQASLADLKVSLHKTCDPLAWTRRHPRTAVAASVATGFAAVAALSTREAKPQSPHLSAKALAAKEPAETTGAAACTASTVPGREAAHAGWKRAGLDALFALAPLALRAALAKAVQAAIQSSAPAAPSSPRRGEAATLPIDEPSAASSDNRTLGGDDATAGPIL